MKTAPTTEGKFMVEIAPAFSVDLSGCYKMGKRKGEYLPEIMFWFNDGTIFTQQYTHEAQRDYYFDKIKI